MSILPAAFSLSDGITALGSIWTWVEGNPALSAMIGIAVAGVGISMIIGIFFRRG